VSPIAIVSGCPGAGKSTLARALSREAPRGLHLDSDLFYGFPAAPIDPATPEAQAQNVSVMRARARSARAFAEGGYDVFLDGVIGPWFLPVFREELRGVPALSYIVLRASEADAVRRVRERDGAGPSARVRRMHAAFAELGELAAHAIETSQRARREVFAEARAGLHAGRFRLRVD
jgi:chloramphenicol 3-O-phosphotransferase